MKNVLLSVADDQRWDTIGAIGDARVLTPNFDRLAARGTAFTNARCQNGDQPAVCIPSRAALHTGRQVHEVPLDCGDYATIGSALRDAGYVSHGVGKWHNGPASYQKSFTGGDAIFFGGMHDHTGMPLYDYDPSGAYASPRPCGKFSSVAFADAAIGFLEHHDPRQPFFLFVGWTSPHDPRTPPEEFARMYDPESLELPPNFLPRHPFDNGELAIRDELLASHPRERADIQQHLADYFGMVSELDSQFGRVMDALERLGLLQDTLVIHTADHGLAVGQHGLMGKQNLYEHSVRIPLVMCGPSVPVGKREEGLCYGFDVAPTILEWAGVSRADSMTACSLLPLVNAESRARSHATAWYRDFQRSVTDGRWKLIRYAVGESLTDQLFDLSEDPWETRNLAAAEPDRVRRMESLLLP